MTLVWCVPCALPEWRAYWGLDWHGGWYAGVCLGRLHVEVNTTR